MKPEQRAITSHIQIVGWNHRRYLEACLRSILQQTVSVPLLYVDNASTDDSVAYVREHFPMVTVHAETSNRGYAGGHNDGLRIIPNTEIAILLNPDIVLEEQFVEEIIKPFVDKRVSAAVPLLLRGRKGEEARRTEETIDAYGTRLTPSLRAVHQYENRSLAFVSSLLPSTSVWGFTGAAVALRRRALEASAIDGEVFDEDLFAYREDVDCSWRLRRGGWAIVGVPAARATHERQVRRGKEKSLWAARLSWRNYFLVLVKNVPARTFVLHSIPLCGEIIVRIVQFVVTPRLWATFPTCVRLLPRFLGKRRLALRITSSF